MLIIRGLIDRRILVNYRVRPEALAGAAGAVRPKLVGGMGMAGICLIRLTEVRPRLVPKWLGLGSENAAHRIAVEWDSDGERPRRRLYSAARYVVAAESADRRPAVSRLSSPRQFQVLRGRRPISIALDSEDGRTHVAVDARMVEQLPSRSIFRSLEEASEFFHRGGLGYSATPAAGVFDGLELQSFNWSIEPLEITRVESSFFGRFAAISAGLSRIRLGSLDAPH